MNKNDLGKSPAFPKIETTEALKGMSSAGNAYGNTFSTGGMDLRTYIATKAMSGVLNMVALTPDKYLVNDAVLNTDEVVNVAFEIADKMLERLQNPQNNP